MRKSISDYIRVRCARLTTTLWHFQRISRMENKYKIVLAILITISISLWPIELFAEKKNPYGVFIGMSPDGIERLFQYDEVIIDAAYYTPENIELLHKNNVKVYSYLNIGSLEKSRQYYSEYNSITLSAYENWPNERWIDVSKQKWHDFIVYDVAESLSEKGIDGFFLDNLSVYDKYPQFDIFEGVYDIVSNLKKEYNKKIIVNGGYSFIIKAISEGIDIRSIINGFNMESVYTNVDFGKGILTKRSNRDTIWALRSLNTIRKLVDQIYVIEYLNDAKTESLLNRKLSFIGYKVYISKSIALN